MLMQLLTDVDLDQEITILGPCIYTDDTSGVAALQLFAVSADLCFEGYNLTMSNMLMMLMTPYN